MDVQSHTSRTSGMARKQEAQLANKRHRIGPETLSKRLKGGGMVGEGQQYHVCGTGTSTGNISSIAVVMDVDRLGEPFVNE
jgi:hypothetical protein